MKKLIKAIIICAIILSGVCGVKIHNVDATQVDFSPEIITTATPPTSYDLRDYIDIGVENQNPFGICYAYASLTSVETYIALNYDEYYDFSEIHFATSLYLKNNYYSNVNQALSDGGNFQHFVLYSQKDNALVLEEEMPTSKYKGLSTSERSNTIIADYNNINNNYYSIAKVNNSKTFDEYVGNKRTKYSSSELSSFRTDVKNHIMQYGSVTAGIHTNSTFTNGTKYYRIMDESLVASQSTINASINHLISIVGWDDNYNANGTWANKGAYLCLNSWGEEFGDDGYFYVSYDDYFIESTIQGVCDVTLSTTNYKISDILKYQNKTAMFTHVFSNGPTIYTANLVDTSSYIGQKITHIDTFIKGDTTKFYIKFFNSRESALYGINSVSSLVSSSKVDDYTLYTKYKLSSPLNITNNYMVVVRETQNTTTTYSLGANSSDYIGIEPCYYNGSGIGYFDTAEDVWDPDVSGRSLDCTLPLILHTNKSYVQVSKFEGDIDSVINSLYLQNNAIFKNKTLKLSLTNVTLDSDDLSGIKITKLCTQSFTDVTSNFTIKIISSNTVSITMVNGLTSTFTTGSYILSIPCGDTTIYRMFKIDNSQSYSITYELYGGQANNPASYTNNHSSISLSEPTKDGYAFVGWYLDSDLTTPFDSSSLPYTDITLYAKYDFAIPTLLSKTKDISVTYYKGINITISVSASHALLNEYNTLSYQWYKSNSLNGSYSLINDATNSSINLNNVSQSGYYVCEISINITDTSLTNTPCIKTLNIDKSNAIMVNIKPYIYDISSVKWSYDSPISYDTTTHTVKLLNLPTGVTATYTNNQQSEIGIYIATATLIYDDMDGNATIENINNLVWQIRKAKITITINDIVSKDNFSENVEYTCQIQNEYLPSNVITHQDKLNYLNVKYQLIETSQPYIKTITATTNTFEIYDITIIDAQYRVVIYTLNSNNIYSTNENGFVQNCDFNATSCTLNSDTIQALDDKNLTAVQSYNLSYSYLQDDKVSVFIPIERDALFNGLTVYMLKDGKLTKLDTSVDKNGISFVTSEQNATYIITHQNYTHTSNTLMIIVIVIIAIYVALCIGAIVSAIKHRNNYLYK